MKKRFVLALLVVNAISIGKIHSESPQEVKPISLLLDTKAATFGGIKFKSSGDRVIRALSFEKESDREAALTEYHAYMKSPKKKANYALEMPGVKGVLLRVNNISGQFAQVSVSSNKVKTTEGLDVDSTYEIFVKTYGKPKIKEYPNNVVLHTFVMPNNPFLSISTNTSSGPVKNFQISYDLKNGP